MAALHSQLLVEDLFKNFFELWPSKFNNKTNGITQRRWLKKCNPSLSALISDKIGNKWVKNLDGLRDLEKSLKSKPFLKKWQESKTLNKDHFFGYLKEKQGIDIPSHFMLDVQVKRIHEYKRQLLPVLHAVHLYNRIKRGDTEGMVPRAIVIGGKAAPGYWMAKQIIHMIGLIGKTINNDPAADKWLKLVFLENYRVSLAEKVMPAADLSEQVSTAGTEASGTGNMKFSLNGALTVGTLDGANVEIAEEVGDENIFIFGLKVDEVESEKANGYNAMKYYDACPELKEVIDLIGSGFFAPEMPQVFKAVLDNIMYNDQYLLFADFESYIRSQDKVSALYADQDAWTKMAILNVARIGKFSSDRTIAQYNDEIWNTPVTPIKM